MYLFRDILFLKFFICHGIITDLLSDSLSYLFSRYLDLLSLLASIRLFSAERKWANQEVINMIDLEANLFVYSL